jgi:glutamate carboxypeptidase
MAGGAGEPYAFLVRMQSNDTLFQFLTARLEPAVELLRQMVAINSHTLNRQGVNELGRFIVQAFAELGFTAEFVPSTNPAFGDHLVLTRRGTGSQKVGLISHLDTVYTVAEEARNDFLWRVEGDRIYGPGTDDIKGGTVMMLLTLSALRQFAPEVFSRTHWVLLLDASEEMESADFGQLCLKRLHGAAAALVFEGGGREGDCFPLVSARKGRATFRIEVAGRGAHAGVNHARGASAIAQLAHTIQRVEALTDHARGLTFNVGLVSGGSALNRVPHQAHAEAEMRAFSVDAYQAGLERLRALERDIAVRSVSDGLPCGVQIIIENETPPWPRNAATDRLLETFRSAAADLGFEVDREERGGISDGNFLCHAVPTLDGLGPKGDNAHCSQRSNDGTREQEYIERSSFVPKAALNVRALMRLLGGAA